MAYSEDLRSVMTNSPTMGANSSLRHHSTGGRGRGRGREGKGGEGRGKEGEGREGNEKDGDVMRVM